MRIRVAIAAVLVFAGVAFGEIEIPVAYDLGVSKGEPIDGFVTGGSFCGEDGLELMCGQATDTSTISYLDVDRITNLAIKGSEEVTMNVAMKDGKLFPASAKIPSGTPLLILRDELASGSTKTIGKERLFNVENFRGIPLIEFQASVPVEFSIEGVKNLTKQFQEAMDKGNFDQAIDLHSQIGEMLENLKPQLDEKAQTGSDEKK